MRFVDDILLNNSALAVSTTTEAVNLETIVNFSVQIVWTSVTASFSIQVEVSNDGLNWVNLGSAAVINNNSGNVMVEKSNNTNRFMRVSVTRTSGTANVKLIYAGLGG